MYSLLSRIPRGLDPLRTTMEKHVQDVGYNAIQNVAATALNVSIYLPFSHSIFLSPIPSFSNFSLGSKSLR